MVESLAVLDYALDPGAPFDILATPGTMEAHIQAHRKEVHRLPLPKSASAMTPRRHVVVYQLDPGDSPNQFIGGLHQAIYGSLGKRVQMTASPPDAFVRIYFVPTGSGGQDAELWEWGQTNQKIEQRY